MIIEFAGEGLVEEAIDAGQKSHKGPTGTSRRGDQHIRSRLNHQLRLIPHVNRLSNVRLKPPGNERVEAGERHRPYLSMRWNGGLQRLAPDLV